MGTNWKSLPAGLPLVFFCLLSCLFFSSCSLPRIIVLEDSRTAEQHNDLGFIYEQQGKLDLAEKEYHLAAGKSAGWYVPYFNLGNVNYKAGLYRKSEEFYRKALEYDPGNADVMNNLAWSLLMQERFVEALEMIEEAIAIEPADRYRKSREAIRDREAAREGGS